MPRDPKSEYLRRREDGFDPDFGVRAKLPEYSALRDDHASAFIRSGQVSRHLRTTGQIDASGKIVDGRRVAHRVAVVERELVRAEEEGRALRREEEEIRARVRAERLGKLGDVWREERVALAKENRRIRGEIMREVRRVTGLEELQGMPNMKRRKEGGK
mmetsp:Transcript_16601/g.33041  ORF Transcript_16601/g.33041 Transcript_16601/m.33041 type:complete len:159 (+) Transcript_16601:1-477(+)